MNETLASPPFGLANLSNCERELIHLAGSIQPHGVLLVLEEPGLVIRQASENCGQIPGFHPGASGTATTVADLGGDLDAVLRALLLSADLSEPIPLRCRIGRGENPSPMEGAVHRHPGGGLIVELEARRGDSDHGGNRRLQQQMAGAVQRFSGALSITSLSDAVVQSVREMTGYDRVMVYKFDPDGHGEIIAEARDAKLESLLGHHYPASDIPQRARELYMRNRVRVLVDVNYVPVPIVPRLRPGSEEELDMSLCHLRSMSPLHLQYLKNMGVTGTLVVSLVREGRLWGLIACHHYAPKQVRYTARAVLELLGEVIATRIAAIENYVQAQVEVLVRRLELRLIEATSTDGDWRQALFRNPRNLLQPLAATGAALFYDGEIMIAGDVPSTPDLRTLMQWVAEQEFESVYACSSVVKKNPALASLAGTASGVLAVRLSLSRPDYLMWFRAEQPCEYTWAGDPSKPLLNDDPLMLSPRRSFAAWSEIVRGTAAPWTRAESVLAKAFGASLVDIIVQIQAVRLLIAKHQLELVRSQVVNSKDAVIIADAGGRILFSNESFERLLEGSANAFERLADLSALFVERDTAQAALNALESERVPWRGELALAASHTRPMPVSMRADVVAGQGAAILGYIVILGDLSARKQTESARRHFESSILEAERMEALLEPRSPKLLREPDSVISAILANASVAAMEISDAVGEGSVVPMLEELEISTQRAAALYCQLRSYLRED